MASTTFGLVFKGKSKKGAVVNELKSANKRTVIVEKPASQPEQKPDTSAQASSDTEKDTDDTAKD